MRTEGRNRYMEPDTKGADPDHAAPAIGVTPPGMSRDENVSLPPRRKLRRNLLLLLFVGIALYFILPRLGTMQHALGVVTQLNIAFVLLAVLAQSLSYLGSGYLLRSVVKGPAESVSVFRGVLVTLAANSIGTLGGAPWEPRVQLFCGCGGEGSIAEQQAWAAGFPFL